MQLNDIFTIKYNSWNVLYKSIKDIEWKKLEGGRAYWYADPILVKWKGKKYLFVEAYDTFCSIGRIAISEWDGSIFRKPKVIIKKPYHMSYPHVFEFHNELYMLPETSQNRTLELYKAEADSLYKWHIVKILSNNIKYVDATVFHYDGVYYVVAYEEGKSKWKTHVFRLDMEQLKIEKIETVILYDNIGRPAGKIFKKNGNIFRPVQLNTERYGGGIALEVINSFVPFSTSRVKNYSADDIKTEIINGISLGMHTLAVDDELYVIDILKAGRNIFATWIIIVRKTRNLVFKILKRQKDSMVYN